MELGYAELFVDLKPSVTADFFIDPPSDADRDIRSSHDFLYHSKRKATVEKVHEALGQHIAYAAEILARQHRVFLFSISLSGSRARFLRWDRAGCVVSEAFDVYENPEILCEFLWRFSQTSHVGRGHDMTVQPTGLDQERMFRRAIEDHVRFQLQVDGDQLENAISQHYVKGRAFIVRVFAQEAPLGEVTIDEFIVSRPVASPLYIAGRGTKGYCAVHAASGRVVFLKDIWCDSFAFTESEGEVLRTMKGVGVRYIPIVECHGFVADGLEEANVVTACESELLFPLFHL